MSSIGRNDRLANVIMRIIATAGHVDHGKSALVRALTGTDPDRWVEEKRRGLTIDLGFAHVMLPSGPVSIVDVPGHRRFIDNMLAGVGVIDSALLVVSSVEGWKPQTEEHLSILELLGIRHLVVALSMIDLADPGQRASARQQIDERVDGDQLIEGGIVATSAATGEGVDDLRHAIDRLVTAAPPAVDHDRMRLWVDRSFTMTGAGTVVTGALTGGGLAVDDPVVVVPGGRATRVRALQSSNAEVTALPPGVRAAVNLARVATADVRRGCAVVQPDRWHVTDHFDASLRVLAAAAVVDRRGAYQVHIGSGHWRARLAFLGPARIEPGSTGHVRVRVPVGLPLIPGDRYIVRDTGTDGLVGGGEILDVDPVMRPSRARPDRSVERVVAERGWITVDALERRTGRRMEPSVGRWVVSPAAHDEGRRAVLAAVDAAGPLGLDTAALDDRQSALVEHDAGLRQQIEVVAGKIRRPGAVADPATELPWVRSLRAEQLTPPPPTGVAAPDLRHLQATGVIVKADDLYFHHTALDAADATLTTLLQSEPAGFTVSEAARALGVSRKYTLAVLHVLESRGRLRRQGDRRVAR